MNIPKMTSLILALMMVLTTFAACDTAETIPDGSVPITPEESAMISEMLEEGMDEEEIAEVLSTMETTEATGETNGNTDVTEPSVVESVAPNGETVRVTPTTAPRQTVTQTIRNADGSTSTVRVTATATPRPTGTATTVPTSTTTTTAPTSATTIARPTTAPSGSFQSSIENELVGLINNIRKARAVEKQREYYVPVQMSDSLRTKARTRCKEIVTSFDHSSASGSGLGSECIFRASSQVNASTISVAWKNSSSHKAMLCGGCTSSNKSAYYCGIGVYYYNGSTYAVYGDGDGVSGTGLPSGYTAPTTTTPTTTTTTTATPTETTAPTTTTTTATPTETTVVTTEATTQVQNSTVDDTGDSGGDG